MSNGNSATLPVSSRKKVYLIFVFISLGLFFFSCWQVKPVVVEASAPLGVASYLSPLYWCGLALLTITAISAFLDRKLQSDTIYIIILLILGLYLIALPAFIYENPREDTNFYPFSEIYRWFPTGNIDIANPPHIASYYSWPVFHFLSATFVSVFGDSFDFFIFAKYVPLFFSVILVFISYSIGKRLNLEPYRCFLLTFLVISSWLLISEYAPRTIGIVLIYLFLMLLISKYKNASYMLITIIIFSTIVITHSLTVIAAIAGLTFFSIYKRDFSLLTLCIFLFGFWYIYVAYDAVDSGIQQFLQYPWRAIFLTIERETTQGFTHTAASISHISWIIYAFVYLSFLIWSLILIIRRNITLERRNQVVLLFFWITGIAIAMLAMGFGDAFHRAYAFVVLPLACIVALSLSKNKLILAATAIIMVLFVSMSVPAVYGNDSKWGQVLTTEIYGSKFFALHIKPEGTYYFDGNEVFIHYYKPSLLNELKRNFNFGLFKIISPSEIDYSLIDNSNYVILSKKSSSRWLLSWGEDPTALWVHTITGQYANLIYNNGDFEVYENHLDE
jgi:hypothetical protein